MNTLQRRARKLRHEGRSPYRIAMILGVDESELEAVYAGTYVFTPDPEPVVATAEPPEPDPTPDPGPEPAKRAQMIATVRELSKTKSRQEIKELTGVDKRTLRDWLEPEAKIAKLVTLGRTVGEIAWIVGWPESKVQEHLR